MDSQIISLRFYFLPAPPQYHEPSISFTISFPICEPTFISPTSYRNSPMGPPPFLNFPRQNLSAMVYPYHTGAPVSVFVHFFPKYSFFIVQTPLFSVISFSFLPSPLATCFPPFGQMQPMSPLDGALIIIYPSRHRPHIQSTPQVTYLYPLQLFTLSRLWHNLAPVLLSP
jgi:hypothetical protein